MAAAGAAEAASEAKKRGSTEGGGGGGKEKVFTALKEKEAGHLEEEGRKKNFSLKSNSLDYWRKKRIGRSRPRRRHEGKEGSL